MRIFLLFAFLSCPLLSACGFEPLYGETRGSVAVNDDLAAIEIGEIPDRLGRVVRNGLLDRLNPYGEPGSPAYRLDVAVTSFKEGYGFRADEAITRENLQLQGHFVLTDLSSGEIVLEDDVRSSMAYDIVQSDFATFSAERDAELRTSEAVVNDIYRKLGFFFRTEKTD